jgi:hypothetical protein
MSACTFTCDPGFGDCDRMAANGCETPLDSNLHCGACGNACGAGLACAGGTCSPTTTFSPNGVGRTCTVQTFTVAASRRYQILARGASGNALTRGWGRRGGRGAQMRGDFVLTAGTTLRILVGQSGTPGEYVGGGGGGSFVVNGTTPLVIAGGGGACGGNYEDGRDASIGPNGVDGRARGGTGGAGGGADGGSGGGGLTGDGANTGSDVVGFAGYGGLSFARGGTGGGGGTQAQGIGGNGGCGGGGSGYGYGYSGGGAGPYAGGGGSFNAGANPVNLAGAGTGAGLVTITYLGP